MKHANTGINVPSSFFILLVFFLKPIVSISQNCPSKEFSTFFYFSGFGYSGFFDKIQNDGYLFGNVRNYKSSVNKTDLNGNLLWAKSYNFLEATTYSERSNGKVDIDANYFIDVNALAVALLNPSGSVLTMKLLKLPNNNDISILGLQVLSDNKKIVLAKDYSTYGKEGYILMCLSPDLSTKIWLKHISSPYLYFAKLNLLDNKIFLSGGHGSLGLLMCYDPSNGNLINQFTYKTANADTGLEQIYKYDNGFIVTARYSGVQNNHLIYRLNNNLEILKSYRVSTVFDNAALVLNPEPDGSFFGTWSSQGFTHFRFKMSQTDSLLWSRQTLTGGLTRPINSLKANDGGLVLVASGNWNNVGGGPLNTALSISKTDENGAFTNCTSYDFAFDKISIPTIKTLSTLQARDSINHITLLNVTPVVGDLTYTINSLCSATNICNSLSILGQTSICTTLPVIYTGRRNSSCRSPITWQILGAPTNLIKISDSTLSVSFLQSGTYTLIASINNSCTNLNDTIIVTVSSLTTTFNIGPHDSTLCAGNTIVLNAGGGFTNYMWQDGSTNSTFNVTQPGLFYVTVTSACGQVFSDTISVAGAPPVNAYIGPDRTKCNNDTIRLSAPLGNIGYTWSPNYQISSLSNSTVVINPLIDTTYFLKVERSPGCFGYDTIKVKVNTSPLIHLGNDTSICYNQYLLLNAGVGFNSYLWNNGSIQNNISINSIGNYSVTATDSNGCKSSDTLRLQNVFSKPNINLDKNDKLCLGSSRQLNAGNFMSYLWQDGSTQSSLQIQTPGMYHVTVIDINGCKTSDTSYITSVVNPPTGFLGKDTSICNYDEVVLKANKTFNSYLWNTGSISSSIKATRSGIYSLKVSDQNKCIGIDSVIITTKECMKGLFFPNAFTPNSDNKNDKIKALLFGNVANFELKIYNRYGQLVFQTINVKEGWDGKFLGVNQEKGSFVWICKYQFFNETYKIEKGLFTLIR